MSIAVVIIATGERYVPYAAPLIASLKKFFPPHKVFLLTDSKDKFDAETFEYPDYGWPRATLFRYHAFITLRHFLMPFGQTFYIDADMEAVSKIEAKDICSSGITCVLHGGFPSTFERRPESKAYVPEVVKEPYYQGTFFGGLTTSFVQMAGDIAEKINRDYEQRIIAVWHDESHLNRYLLTHPPAKVLTPAYCWSDGCIPNYHRWGTVPLDQFVPTIRHIEKPDQSWKNG